MTDITSVAANVHVVVEHATSADEEGVQEGTSTMSDVVDSASSDKSFSRESTPSSLSEEVPPATNESAEAFRDGESINTLSVPPFRPKGQITLQSTTNKPPKK
ncbi:uncharacterized protein FOMMEDRAFT_148785 [Fomitiporia mediterranea MF3/22]|uniref:uncharacterized protein n=1 Tax=Fomitiporia mediterranea (strain MF3/22) TaxID=694068 RepID=UPI0004407BDC|nr:uncharacterized protein FOMMEDRAFT_148785 [Fomitiporia mediterranea MF3/22]EJC99264.1 hypothetical protein FOMMEDRAFT_148785 [Fomitiporia mediterranea MF3/22]